MFIHFPKAESQVAGVTRNLYVNVNRIDYVFSDSSHPNVTVIISGGQWQKVDMPLSQVMSLIQKVSK